MRKAKKIDRIVAGVLLYWLLMVLVGWISYFVTGGIPDTLIQVGLGGGAVELVATAAIEILSNNRRGDNEGDTTGDTTGGTTDTVEHPPD